MKCTINLYSIYWHRQ